jgi:FecR protein
MVKQRKWFWLAFLIITACLVSPLASPASAQDSVVVGRVSDIDGGQLLRYVPDNQDWVAIVKDAPFGMDDALYSDQSARAEFIMPNGLWARIGGSTQIQLIALKSDASEMDLASGVARFYNKSSGGMLKVTTPFGYILAEPGSTFDTYVGDQSVEVIALNGGVDFIHQANNAKYDVVPGSGSIIADASQVGSGDGNVDAEWDDWNAGRDSLWANRPDTFLLSFRTTPTPLKKTASGKTSTMRARTISSGGLLRLRLHGSLSPTAGGRNGMAISAGYLMNRSVTLLTIMETGYW